MSLSFQIEHSGSSDTGICDCCGRNSRRVWGFVRLAQGIAACYFVNWTLGHVADKGASSDLIVGKWGGSSSAADRLAVRLDYRLLDDGPTFMVTDADCSDVAQSDLVGRALKRTDVVGQPISQHVFALCDAVLSLDARVAELLGDWKLVTR